MRDSFLDLNIGLSVPEKISNLFTVFNQTVESITDFIRLLKSAVNLFANVIFYTELMEMKRKRHKLERMYRKHKISFVEYKQYDRKMRNCFVDKKREHFRKKINVTQTPRNINLLTN